MSRLDDIRQRNERGSWQLKHNWHFGLRSLFLLGILGLLAFTKWAIPPADHRPGITITPPPGYRPKQTGGTLMMRPPKVKAQPPVRP